MKGRRVYFIADDVGRLKIGVAADPHERLRYLQVGCAGRLRLIGSLPGSFDLERHLHGLFADLRLTGEWFIASRELLKEVERLCASVPQPQVHQVASSRPSKQGEAAERRAMIVRIADHLRSIHPSRTADNVAADTGLATDTIRKWLGHQSLPSFAVLGVLIGTYGPEFVAAWMGEQPPWLDANVRAARAAELDRQIAELRAAREGL